MGVLRSNLPRLVGLDLERERLPRIVRRAPQVDMILRSGNDPRGICATAAGQTHEQEERYAGTVDETHYLPFPFSQPALENFLHILALDRARREARWGIS